MTDVPKQKRAVRSHVLPLRLNDEERERIRSLAAQAGCTPTDLLRRHVGRVKVRDATAERQRVAMLNRINANLNMIARWVNTHKASADAVQVIAHLVAIEREIAGIVERGEA